MDKVYPNYPKDAAGRNQRDHEREFLMVSLLSGGLTLEEVGKQFGVTRERVRQIVARLGLRSRTWSRHDPVAITRATEQARFLEEAAELANTTPHGVRRVLKALGKWDEARDRWGVERHNYTEDELLDFLRAEATALGKTPGQVYLRNCRPSATTYASHFGTLTEALRRAGLPLNSHRRDKLQGSEDEVIRRYLAGEIISDLAPEFDVTYNAIHHLLVRRGIVLRNGRAEGQRARRQREQARRLAS